MSRDTVHRCSGTGVNDVRDSDTRRSVARRAAVAALDEHVAPKH